MSASHGLGVTSEGTVYGWSMWNMSNRVENVREVKEMSRHTYIRTEARLNKWLRGKGDVTQQEIARARAALQEENK